jgi:hypothetical protein
MRRISTGPRVLRITFSCAAGSAAGPACSVQTTSAAPGAGKEADLADVKLKLCIDVLAHDMSG